MGANTADKNNAASNGQQVEVKSPNLDILTYKEENGNKLFELTAELVDQKLTDDGY